MTEADSQFIKGGQGRWKVLLTQLLHYGVALLSVALALGGNLLFSPYLDPTPTPLFFAAVMLSAWYGGLGPGLLATALSTLAIHYFLVEPVYSFSISNLATLAGLSVFIMTAILINSLQEAQRAAQRRAEANLQSLRQSEARFGGLAESNIIGIIVADLNGPILEANDIFLQMVGYTQEELRSGRMRWREMTPPESLEVSERAVEELIRTGACTPFEKEYIRKDGSRIPVLHGAVMTGETTVIGFVLDITNRKRAEAKLQRTNQTLQILIDACPVAIAFFDPQGIVRLWNRAAEKIFGWSAEEAIGQFMPTVPHRTQEFLASIQMVLSGRSLKGFEAQHQRKDGQMVDLEIWANLTHDAEGNPGCLGIAWDITQSKQVESALHESEARFQVLVSNMPGMVYRYNPFANGSAAFTYVSSGSRELLELEPEAILQDANAFLRLIHADDLPSFADSVAIATANSLPWQWEGRLITPSGQLKWVQGRSRPENTEYAKAWDGLLLDISDRKQAEESLRQSEERLRVALKNSPITVFNQDHELRYTWLYNPTLAHHQMQVIGKQDADLLSSEDAAAVTQIKRRVLETGVGAQAEVKLTMQGQDFYYDLTVEPLQNPHGDIIGVTCASINITKLKQTELALRQSEERLRLAMEGAQMGTWDVNLLTGKAIWSEQHFRMLGYEPTPTGEATEAMWNDQIHPYDQERVALEWQQSRLEHRLYRVEYRVIKANSHQIAWLAAFGSFIYNQNDEAIRSIGVLFDISDRKRDEEALCRSEERFRISQDLSLDAFTILDSVRDQTGAIVDFVWIYVNPKAAEILQHSVEELVGQRLLEVLPGNEINSELFARYARVVETGVAHDIELSYNADGITGWFRNMAVKLEDGVAISFSDITGRKQTETALRESEERLRLALIAANQGLYDLNVQTGDAVVSPEYARMLGYEPEDFQETNAKWRDRIHPDDLAFVYQVYEDYVAGKLDTYRVEFRQRTKSGAWKWILSLGKIVSWDSQGQPLRMLGTHTDITDRKLSEAERERLLQREQAAREDAETANRIKDEFLAVLSHELRSPLNPILGWSKLLQAGNLDAKTSQRALETIERNAKLQTQLIDDLLDVSRILRGKLALQICPVNIVTVVESALETVRLAAEAKHIQIKTVVTLDAIHVAGDAGRLQQIVWNLLSNAVKFTSNDGQVEIRLDQIGIYVQIQVKDTGKGISRDFLPYVFDYFRQEDSKTTRKFGGLGLGLAIVRHLTELHGGTTQVDSPGVGQGATFTIQLPLMPSFSAINHNCEQPQQVLSLNGIKVLVVDDDRDAREFVAFLLEQEMATVVTAASGPEALTGLSQFKPSIILSDIGMPDMDGYMLMQKVRALPPEQGGLIKAIALTAYAGEYDQQQALKAGFQKHISKPVEPETLLKAIFELIADGGNL
jgi:PAS domain S-box-containing protein